MGAKILSKVSSPWLIALIVLATAVTGGTVVYSLAKLTASSPTPDLAAELPPPAQKVTALGRLEPEAEVIRLAAPLSLDGDRVAQVLVKEGDRVQAKQVVAILDSRDRLQDALRQAQEQVRVAQSKLAQVKAGAKSGEILAQQATVNQVQAQLRGELETQKATIARWQSETRTARAEYQRFLKLYQQGAVAASELDSKRLAAETAQSQLNEAQAAFNRTNQTLQAQVRQAQATLSQIAEVRPVDVQAAQTEVESAIAAQKQAQTDLAQTYIRAPMSGQILKIHTKPGEKISSDGIADLGQTERMVAVAEVYQTDIDKIRVGQPAVITGEAFTGELRGTVALIGRQVLRQNTFSNQPGENLDRRVVEVKIRLNPQDSQKVSGLTNLQVDAAIQL
jgi:HlyD family secretion protein